MQTGKVIEAERAFFGGYRPQAFECGWHSRFCIIMHDGWGWMETPRHASLDRKAVMLTALKSLRRNPSLKIAAIAPLRKNSRLLPA